MKTILNTYWSHISCEVCHGKFDMLPRVTLFAIAHAFIFNLGFLCFSLNFTFWDKRMREFNRKSHGA